MAVKSIPDDNCELSPQAPSVIDAAMTTRNTCPCADPRCCIDHLSYHARAATADPAPVAAAEPRVVFPSRAIASRATAPPPRLIPPRHRAPTEVDSSRRPPPLHGRTTAGCPDPGRPAPAQETVIFILGDLSLHPAAQGPTARETPSKDSGASAGARSDASAYARFLGSAGSGASSPH
jgi:hypothetical protein